MPRLIVFQTYAEIGAATEVAEHLRQSGITAEVVKSLPRLDAAIIGPSYADNFILKIQPEDFIRANDILYNDTQVDVDRLDTDHPLYSMTNEELKNIIAKPDEWGADNYNIAVALLKSRGVNVPDKLLHTLKDQRISELSEKKSFSPYLLFNAYAAAVVPFLMTATYYNDWQKTHVANYTWCLPGLLGLFIGVVIIMSRMTLPDGRRIRSFSNATVRHGIAIIALNLISIIANLLIGLSFSA